VQSFRRPVNTEVTLAEIVFCPQWTVPTDTSLHLGDFIALSHGAKKPAFQTIISKRRATTADALFHVFVRVRNFHFIVVSLTLFGIEVIQLD